MTIQDIVALALAATAVAYIAYSMWRTVNGVRTCNRGCACQHSAPSPIRLGTPTKRSQPLVTPDQVGRPSTHDCRDGDGV